MGWVELEEIEEELSELGYLGEMHGGFAAPLAIAHGGMPGLHMQHGGGGGDIHQQLQAVQLELQALRLELQALRMQMGAMRGGMGHGMGGGMGHTMAPMPMMGTAMPRIQMRNMRSPRGNMMFGGPESMILREIKEGDGHTFEFFGGEHGEHGEHGQFEWKSEHGDHGGEWNTDIEFDHEDFDFDFDFDELHAIGGDSKVHSEMRLIINGEVFEGEEAQKKLEELKLHDTIKMPAMRLRAAPAPPAPPTPAAPSRRRPHSHEEL